MSPCSCWSASFPLFNCLLLQYCVYLLTVKFLTFFFGSCHNKIPPKHTAPFKTTSNELDGFKNAPGEDQFTGFTYFPGQSEAFIFVSIPTF